MFGYCWYHLPDFLALASVCHRFRAVLAKNDRMFNTILVFVISESRWHARYGRVDNLFDAEEDAADPAIAGLDTGRPAPTLDDRAAPRHAPGFSMLADGDDGDGNTAHGDGSAGSAASSIVAAPAGSLAPLDVTGEGNGVVQVTPGVALSRVSVPERSADTAAATPTIWQQANAAYQEDRLGCFDYGPYVQLRPSEVRRDC